MAVNATNTQSLGNISATDMPVNLELYGVIINFGALFLLALPGILLNLAVLISTRCKKGIRNLQYGLYYTLFIINIVLCFAWMPLHVTQIYFNYNQHSLPVALCYLSTGLFNICIASNVFLVVVIGVLHLHHLSSSPIPAIHSLVKRGIIASLLTALLLTGLIIAEHPYNVSYELCTTGKAPKANIYKFSYSIISVLLSIAYITMLLVMMILLWLAVHAIRQRIHEMVHQARTCPIALGSTHDCADDIYEVSRGDEPSKHSSVTFKEPEICETIPNNNGISKLTNNLQHKGIKFKDNPDEGDDDGDDDDEDMFDMKMRLRLQQKTNSGRRHTVANIGLGDSLFGSKRRGSLDVQRSPTTPGKGYNYIRKWSVDITALQNQLENPKTHTGSYPFRELGILPEKDTTSPPEEENGDNDDDDKADERSVSIAQTAPEMSISEGSEERKATDFRERLSVTEVPSIVIDDGMEDSEWHTDQSDANRNADPEENNHIDEEIVHRFQKQLKKSKKIILFYLSTLFSLLPCFVVYILQGAVTAHLGVNLVSLFSPLCLLTCIVQPIILVWIDTRMKQAIKRLWNKLTHWKCVCYCNIGTGKKFFGKPKEMEDKVCEA